MRPAEPDEGEAYGTTSPVLCYCEDQEHADFLRAVAALTSRDRRALSGLLTRLADLDSEEALNVISDVEGYIREGRQDWGAASKAPAQGRRLLPT